MVIPDESSSQDFKWATELNKKYFGIVGIWPKDHNDPSKYWQTYQVILEAFLLAVCLVLPQFYALILIRNDLDLIIQNLFTAIEFVACIIKVVVLWINLEALQAILDSIAMDWHAYRLSWQRNIMLKMANRGRHLTTTCIVFSCIVMVGFTILPGLGYNLRLEVTNVTNLNGRNLPFSSHYPYDFSKTPYFEICFISQVATCCIAAICFTGPVTVFGVFVYHVCGQIEILCIRMEQLCNPPSECTIQLGNKSRGWTGEVGEIVTTHSKIISTVGNIEKYLNILILVQIIITPVALCLIGFRVVTAFTHGDHLPFTQGLIFTSTVIFMLGHVFVYCFLGQMLISQFLWSINVIYSYCAMANQQSEELHKSVYQSEWYVHRGRETQNLIPIMAHSKWPLRLSAGKYVFLNLGTFCNILKTIASYLSMLVAVNK